MQRKTIVLAVLLLCFALLTGCAATPNKEPNSDNERSDKETVTKVENPELSDDADNSVPDVDFDLEGWLSEGWLGPTAVGIAYDDRGMNWQISAWDNSVNCRLSFYLNGSGDYDGEVSLECFYSDGSVSQAKWQGRWKIEPKYEQPSRLYLGLKLTSGADMGAFENAADVSESYLAMVSQSGNGLLLISESEKSVLPIFPEGVRAAELKFADG